MAEENLHERMHKKILHAKHRNHISEKEVYQLSKEFFAELLKLDYEFTHEELIEELKRIYLEREDLDQTIAYIKKVGVMEFTTDEYNQDELRTMLVELQDVLNRLAREEKKLGWVSRLRQALFGKPKTTEEQQEVNDEKERILHNLLEKLKTAKESEKQELYQQAIITYELLSEESKVTFYNDLLGIYYELQKQEQHAEQEASNEQPVEEMDLDHHEAETPSAEDTQAIPPPASQPQSGPDEQEVDASPDNTEEAQPQDSEPKSSSS